MENLIKKILNSHFLTSLYTDKNDYDVFSVGYITHVDNEYVLFEEYNSNGRFDGYTIRKKEEIYRIETDTRYLRKIERLIMKKHSCADILLPTLTSDILLNILPFLIEHNRVVCICLNQDADNLVGVLEGFKNNIISLQQISQYGEKDGKCYIYKDDVQKIMFCDEDSRDLELLFFAEK